MGTQTVIKGWGGLSYTEFVIGGEDEFIQPGEYDI